MRFFTFLLLVLIFQIAFSQIPVGHYMDSQGMPIVGYFDPSEYDYENSLYCYIPPVEQPQEEETKFHKGYYYFNGTDHKVNGHFQYKGNKLLFSSKEDGIYNELPAYETNCIVVGSDSILVTYEDIYSDYSHTTLLTTKKYYIKYFQKTDNVHLAFKGLHDSDMTKLMIKETNTGEWTSIFDISNEKLKQDYFPINTTTSESIQESILTAEFHSKYVKGTPLLFDKYWNEVEDTTAAYYIGKIRSMDSNVIIDYYEDNFKFKTSEKQNHFPFKNNGVTTFFYPSGKTRRELIYANGKAKTFKEYYENGIVHYSYHLEKVPNSSYQTYFLYTIVNDAGGKSYLTSDGDGTEVLFDSINSREITREFEDGKIKVSYFLDESNNKVYQWVNKNVNLQNIRISFNTKMDEIIKDSTEQVNYPILVSLSINNMARFSDFELLNTIENPNEALIKDFFINGCSEEKPYKLNKLKVGNEKVAYEILIPVLLIGGTPKNNSNWYFDPNWMYRDFERQQQMEMMIKNFTPPSPPSFPR